MRGMTKGIFKLRFFQLQCVSVSSFQVKVARISMHARLMLNTRSTKNITMDWAFHRGAWMLPVNSNEILIYLTIPSWCSTCYSRVFLPSITWRRELQVFIIICKKSWCAHRCLHYNFFYEFDSTFKHYYSCIMKCILTNDGLQERTDVARRLLNLTTYYQKQR